MSEAITSHWVEGYDDDDKLVHKLVVHVDALLAFGDFEPERPLTVREARMLTGRRDLSVELAWFLSEQVSPASTPLTEG